MPRPPRHQSPCHLTARSVHFGRRTDRRICVDVLPERKVSTPSKFTLARRNLKLSKLDNNNACHILLAADVCDCEYKRNGTANVFVFLDVHCPWRQTKLLTAELGVDFAVCMRDLTDVYFPKASHPRRSATPSTQLAGMLYRAFLRDEARRVLRRLELPAMSPSTPAGSTWLKSRSESCDSHAWTGGSPQRHRSNSKLLLVNDSAMPPPLASNAGSQPIRPTPK